MRRPRTADLLNLALVSVVAIGVLCSASAGAICVQQGPTLRFVSIEVLVEGSRPDLPAESEYWRETGTAHASGCDAVFVDVRRGGSFAAHRETPQ